MSESRLPTAWDLAKSKRRAKRWDDPVVQTRRREHLERQEARLRHKRITEALSTDGS